MMRTPFHRPERLAGGIERFGLPVVVEDQPVVARNERLAEQPALPAFGLESRFRPTLVWRSARDGEQMVAAQALVKISKPLL